ncbi:MAG: tetratricopeptide repeat protein [Xanthobacteraceae bacterium]
MLWVAIAVSLSAAPVTSASHRDHEDCQQSADPDRGIAGCTHIIEARGEAARSRTIAYYNRGNAHYAKGDYDRAIADYTEAIWLDPTSPLVFNNRGKAYLGEGDLDRAIADYDEAIRLDPLSANPFNNRGKAYLGKGDYGRAIADYTEVIRLDPKNADGYRLRGIAHLYGGTPAAALADVSQASEVDPKDGYNALWLDIVGRRNHIPSRLSQTSAKLDMTAWPAPVIRMFLGQMTPAGVLAAADDPDPSKKKGRLCEASFYGGELALLTSARDEVTRLLQTAASDCPKNFDEWGAANVELKALGVTR